MGARLLNATQLSILLTVGPDVYTPFILAPAAQAYTIDCYVPVDMACLQVAGVLSAGTVTGNLQRIRGGVTVSLTGLSAMALTNVLTTFNPTAPTDGTQQFTAGDILQITLSAPAGGAANLALSIQMQRNG
jgi:Zn-dependent alcohol dehydrogenase